jgi:DNA-binding response OmpR family regulator
MKLLIVEGEQVAQDSIMRYMKREGHLCECAAHFQEAYKKVVNYEYDCIILNPDLSGADGMKLIRILKEQRSEAGIIVVSARDSADQRVAGLNEGADDFLSRPFNLPELNARVKAVVRRKSGQSGVLMDFGALKIRLDERTVEAGGDLLPLTRKEFDILAFLARNKNRVVTKDAIAEHLWGDYMEDPQSYNFIHAHVKNLRKKLSAPGCADYLKTVYGIGYKFTFNT